MAEDAAGVRASDAERDVVMSQLGNHFQAGRLDQDEFAERLDAAAAARTRGDLAALLTDLPAETEPWTEAPPPARPRSRTPQRWTPAAVGIVLFAAVAGVITTVVAARQGYWVPWWLLPVTILIIRRLAWRGYGNSS